MEAFKKYDFDNDEGWNAYLSRVEIPNDSEALMLKLKAKYYRREIDPSFDVSSVAETPAPTPAPAAPTGSEPARPEPSKPTPTTSAAARPSRSTLYCLAGEVALIAAAVLSLQPLSPRLAMTGLTLTCQMALLTNGIKIFSRQGLPSLRPFPGAFMPWLTGVTSDADFFPLLFSVILTSNRHLGMGVVPLAINALLHADSELHRLFGAAGWYAGTLGRVHALVAPRVEQLRLMQAAGEIWVAVIATLSVVQLGIRGGGTAFVLWNQMRFRFNGPRTARYHRQVWSILNMKLQPVLQRVPVLQQLADRGASWFRSAA